MAELFVGLPVSKDTGAVLEKALGGLHAGTPVAREHMHLSLAELGEQPDEVMQKLRQELSGLDVGPFPVEVDGLDTAGGNPPSGLNAAVPLTPALKALQRLVVRAAREAGIPLASSRYVPGVTIATFDSIGQHDLKQIMSFLSRRSALTAGPFLATDITLWARRIEEGALVHDEIESFALMGRQIT